MGGWCRTRALRCWSSWRIGSERNFSAIVRDITERKQHERELQQLADHDPITNLFNRRRFEQVLEVAPGPEETGDGWAADERSRLGRLARRLWDGLLDREQVSSR